MNKELTTLLDEMLKETQRLNKEIDDAINQLERVREAKQNIVRQIARAKGVVR